MAIQHTASEHVSGAWAAKKTLRAPSFFCNAC